jgi:CBS domain-containing protein
MSVQKILQVKGSKVFAIGSNETVFQALQLMGEKNIGALVVMDQDKMVGILSERDYARKIILKGKASQETLVHEIMTASPIVVAPSDSIETCMGLMSSKHIRHLPVVENEKVVGMVSISDVVTNIITSQKEIINHLQSYITQ